jgi:hypothetical protein
MYAKFMKQFPEDFTVVVIIGLGTCIVGFGMSLLWFRTVGRELDREAISLASKIFGGIFIGGILFFLALKFL